MMRANTRISIVDDDESVRSSITNYFQAAGLNVQAFPSAETFLGSSESHRTDCLVTDLDMPGISGLELHRQLRSLGQGFPIIIMTGFATEAARRDARDLGAAAFLEKPVDPDDLLSQIADALSQE